MREELQSKIAELKAYKVCETASGRSLCYIADYSLKEAVVQAKQEVAEAFDVSREELTVEAANPDLMVAGKPLSKHILECSVPRPQRILDFA